VLIAGGGVAALEVLLGLRKLTGEPEVELELVCPQREFVYRPLSVIEPFDLGAAPAFDLGRICDEHQTQQIVDRVVGIDTRRSILQTESSGEVEYDAAVLALGAHAHAHATLPNAITFTGSGSHGQLASMLSELERGEVHNVAFFVPSGVTWALPAYELALMTSERIASHGIPDAHISMITSEQAPLRIFGRAASDKVASLLKHRKIELRTSTQIAAHDGDSITLVPSGSMTAERIVAMPQLSGPRLRGLPHDADGFLRTDGFGLVEDTDNVYAAGDMTSFPIKQGGIATQQADSIVTKLAARFGGDVKPRPFRPVLRGLLISEGGPNYLRAEIAGGAGDNSEVSSDPLWWPPGKIMGRYLSPYLAGLAGRASGRLNQS